MAVLKVIPPSGKYKDTETYVDTISYITAPEKTPSHLCVARGVRSPETAAMEMEAVTSAYGKGSGTKVRHSILSFAPSERVSKREVYEVARKMTDFYAGQYQIVATVHEDKRHVHVHTIMNTTSFVDGKKYAGRKEDYYGFMEYMGELLREKKISLRKG